MESLEKNVIYIVKEEKQHNVEHRHIHGIRERNRRPYRSIRCPISFYIRTGVLQEISLVNATIGNHTIPH